MPHRSVVYFRRVGYAFLFRALENGHVALTEAVEDKPSVRVFALGLETQLKRKDSAETGREF